MKNDNEKGVGAIPTPELQKVRGDLATLDMAYFMKEYNCSESDYFRILESFGTDELIDFLYGITTDILIGDIKVCPDSIRKLVIRNYQLRIIRLVLHDYAKKGAVIYRLGYA